MNTYYANVKCPHCEEESGVIAEYRIPDNVKPIAHNGPLYRGEAEKKQYYQQCNQCDGFIVTTTRMDVFLVVRKMTDEEIENSLKIE